MQSPAHKMQKLKSLVQRAPAPKNYQNPPYKALETDPQEFIQYLMQNLDRKAYDAKIRCLAALPPQSSIIACRMIMTTVTAMVAHNKGVQFLMPFIPTELMTSLPNPSDSELPVAPVHSTDYQTDVRIKCKREWTYFLHILQYWYDASTM